MNSHEVFIHIHQGCFAGTGAIVRLPQCQWSKPNWYGKISQCITTTKHSKAKTVCIFLGIYCSTLGIYLNTGLSTSQMRPPNGIHDYVTLYKRYKIYNFSPNWPSPIDYLTQWGRYEICAILHILQTTFSNTFPWMKIYWFHINLFPGVQLTIFQHWFR